MTIKISSTIWEYGISIHTFLAEGDNFNVFSSSNDSYFNPHLPCGRWHASGTIGITLPDFNPHLPCGRWLLLSAMAISASDFNPHLPCGRWRSGRIDRRCRDCTFQSTPSLRKVTTPLADICNCRRISIHTFLAEGDEDQYRICKRLRISIHTFLAEGDTLSRFSPLMSVAFQSTPSLRKVTENTGYVITSRVISIHTFLAEGDVCSRSDRPIFPISIHTFLAEGDGGLAGKGNWVNYFNPHLPCGRWLRYNRLNSQS